MNADSFRSVRYKPGELDLDTQRVVEDYNAYMQVLREHTYAIDQFPAVLQGVTSCIAYIMGVGEYFYKKWLFAAVYELFSICKDELLEYTEDDNLQKIFDRILPIKFEEESLLWKVATFTVGTAASFIALPGFDTLGEKVEEEYAAQAKAYYQKEAIAVLKKNRIILNEVSQGFLRTEEALQRQCEEVQAQAKVAFAKDLQEMNPRGITEVDRRELVILCREMQIDPSIIPPKPDRTAIEWIVDTLKIHFGLKPELLAMEVPTEAAWQEYLLVHFNQAVAAPDAESELRALPLSEEEKQMLIATVSDELRLYYQANVAAQLNYLQFKIEKIVEHFFKTSPLIFRLNASVEKWPEKLMETLSQLFSLPGVDPECMSLYVCARPEQVMKILHATAEKTFAQYSESLIAHLARYQKEFVQWLRIELYQIERPLRIAPEQLHEWSRTKMTEYVASLSEDEYFRRAYESINPHQNEALINAFVIEEGRALFESLRETQIQAFKEIVLLSMSEQYKGMDDAVFFDETSATGDAWKAVIIRQIDMRMRELDEDMPLRDIYVDLMLPENGPILDAIFTEVAGALSEERDVYRQMQLVRLSNAVALKHNLHYTRAVLEGTFDDMSEVQRYQATLEWLKTSLTSNRLVLSYLTPAEQNFLVTTVSDQIEDELLKTLTGRAFLALTTGAVPVSAGGAYAFTPALLGPRVEAFEEDKDAVKAAGAD
jgi:hypothetical protein